MRKLLFLFPAFAAFAFLGCGGDDMPCLDCNDDQPTLSNSSRQSSSSVILSEKSSGSSVILPEKSSSSAVILPEKSSSSSVILSEKSSSSAVEPKQSSSSVDVCDIKNYETIKVEGKIWMAENLNCNATGSKCYGNDTDNCITYGRLYDWTTAKTICPLGWRLPSNEEWDELVSYVDGKDLKAKEGWHNCGPNDSYLYLCEDKHNFAALPGGGGYSEGVFSNVGYYGYWWTASEYNTYGAYYRVMSYASDDVDLKISNKSYLFSVRCIKD